MNSVEQGNIRGVNQEFLGMKIDQQLFGIPVSNIKDVLSMQKITKVPKVKPQVKGLINLRGRVVTVLDLRKILGIDTIDKENAINVVVSYKDELYSLVVDTIDEVIMVNNVDVIDNPENLEQSWQSVSVGILPRGEELMVIVDINKLLNELHLDDE